VHPGGAGNGGGLAETEYIECNQQLPFAVQFLHRCSQSGVRVKVTVQYFTEAKVYISAETPYDVTTNPTGWDLITTSALTIPSTAQFCKIFLIGGAADTDPGSSTDIFFDAVQLVDLASQTVEQTSAGGIGSYVFASRSTAADVALGGAIPGSDLVPASAARFSNGGTDSASLDTGTALSGTWRAMGTYDYSVTNLDTTWRGATLWQRIA
jgi:hypothetical protein